MRTARVTLALIALAGSVTACGDDDKTSASKALGKQTSKIVQEQTSKLAKDLENASKLAKQGNDKSEDALPKPCSILTPAEVKSAFGGEPKNTTDSELECTYDIEGTPNFLVEGTTPIISPSISLRLRHETYNTWKYTANMLNGSELSEGIGEARSYGDMAGGLFSWIRKDGVAGDAQLVTVGMDTDKDTVKSELIALATELNDKL